jgi:hypothetical protein
LRQRFAHDKRRSANALTDRGGRASGGDRAAARLGGLAALILVALSILAIGAEPARAADPTRVWKTIESAHFVIHYYEPLDDVAARVAQVAERAHGILAAALGHEPSEKTQVVLLDDTDGANGFANVLPRNTVTLFVTAPRPGSGLVDHDDWLYGLFVHEYTHILHLDTMSGLPSIYNAIFGKIWAPNQIMPRWIIEGIATYEESKRSSAGRTRSSDFDMFLRVPVLEGTALRLDEITNSPRRFPRGNAAYLYGAHFLKYVFDRFGDDALRRMIHVSGANPIPFAVNRQIATVVGKPFDALYRDWQRHLRDRYTAQAEAITRRGLRVGRRLTRSSEVNAAPRYSADGRELLWLRSDGYTRSQIMALPVAGEGGQARTVRSIEAVGSWDVLADGSLVYEQNQAVRGDYSFQDLFRWDRQSGHDIRLTHGMRARDPSVSPDESEVAFVLNRASQSVLAVAAFTPGATPEVMWQGPGRFDQAFEPAWSPRGDRVAFSAWTTGGNRDIVIVHRHTREVAFVTHDRATENSPAWSPDGEILYFDSDRSGVTNIFAYELSTATLWQVSNVIGGAFEPAVSRDGSRLAYRGFVGDGSDLFELELDRATWSPAELYIDDRPDPVRIEEAAAEALPVRAYRPLETLAAQTWAAELALGTLERALIVRTQGNDVVGLHNYALSASLDLARGDVNFGIGYGYSGWRPGVRLALARSVGERGGFRLDGVGTRHTEENIGATLSLFAPAERRPEHSWSFSLDYDFDWIHVVEAPAIDDDPNDAAVVRPLDSYRQTGLAMRVSYGRTRGTLFSTGPNQGFELSLGTRVDLPELGAHFRSISGSYGLTLYRGVPWARTPTIFARLTGAIRRGDLPRSGAYALGGVARQDLVRSVLDNSRVGSTGILRGYPPRTIDGTQFHLLNVEYRHELFNLERGLATLPAYFRRVHAALLFDIGTAFDDAPSRDRLRAALGGALRIDNLLGYHVPGTLELGYAHGLTEGSIGEGWMLLTGTL